MMEFDAVVNGVEKRLRITPHGIMAGDELVGEELVGEDAKIVHPQFHPTRGLHLSASEQAARGTIPRMVSRLQNTTRRMLRR